MAFANAALGAATLSLLPTMVASAGPPISSATSRAMVLEMTSRVPSMEASTSSVSVFALTTASSGRFSNLVFTATSAILVAMVLLIFFSS